LLFAHPMFHQIKADLQEVAFGSETGACMF
jgi:hypothetical protein